MIAPRRKIKFDGHVFRVALFLAWIILSAAARLLEWWPVLLVLSVVPAVFLLVIGTVWIYYYD